MGLYETLGHFRNLAKESSCARRGKESVGPPGGQLPSHTGVWTFIFLLVVVVHSSVAWHRAVLAIPGTVPARAGCPQIIPWEIRFR